MTPLIRLQYFDRHIPGVRPDGTLELHLSNVLQLTIIFFTFYQIYNIVWFTCVSNIQGPFFIFIYLDIFHSKMYGQAAQDLPHFFIPFICLSLWIFGFFGTLERIKRLLMLFSLLKAVSGGFGNTFAKYWSWFTMLRWCLAMLCCIEGTLLECLTQQSLNCCTSCTLTCFRMPRF